jgi:hypothetical protein
MRSFIKHRVAVALGAAVLAAGCSTTAPQYAASVDNIELIKAKVPPSALGAFSVQSGATGATSIGLRGSNMVSPVGADYAVYLGEALRQELQLAGKLDPKSGIEIGGLLLKNDIAAGGISTNSGEVEARFTVRRGGQVRYEKTQRAASTWDSSFMGSVAIPLAMQKYPQLVQTLIRQLLSDAEFIAALQ